MNFEARIWSWSLLTITIIMLLHTSAFHQENLIQRQSTHFMLLIPFSTPLKTSENQIASDISGGTKKDQSHEWVNQKQRFTYVLKKRCRPTEAYNFEKKNKKTKKNRFFSRIFFTKYSYNTLRDHSFSSYAKFSEKPSFHTP